VASCGAWCRVPVCCGTVCDLGADGVSHETKGAVAQQPQHVQHGAGAGGAAEAAAAAAARRGGHLVHEPLQEGACGGAHVEAEATAEYIRNGGGQRAVRRAVSGQRMPAPGCGRLCAVVQMVGWGPERMSGAASGS
jgi:hypothetical protein